jgi:protein TonB
MFDLVTGKAIHIPSRPAVPLVVSTLLQASLVTALLVPLLLFTGIMPEPPMMMAFVAAPPPPPPPPPPPAPPAPKKETQPAARPVPTSGVAAPIEPPPEIAPDLPGDEGFGVPGGVEGGIPGGIVGGIVGGLPDVPLPPPPPPAPKEPVRVGGQIREPALIRRVDPVYPTLAVHAQIEGTVILEAIVDREGRVESVKVLRSANSLLDKSAIEAVRQWQYSPVILNGKPERFMLTVVLSFHLERSGS